MRLPPAEIAVGSTFNISSRAIRSALTAVEMSGG
jgi:hypothetical protein